uniref:Uncharacterized protein n=1 Tax=Salix viminalis TaxID=40686 RepID=A0A6N2M6E5_SALVM
MTEARGVSLQKAVPLLRRLQITSYHESESQQEEELELALKNPLLSSEKSQQEEELELALKNTLLSSKKNGLGC